MADDITGGCDVEGCEADAVERAPGVQFCDTHWTALCDAYARQCAQRPASPVAGASPHAA